MGGEEPQIPLGETRVLESSKVHVCLADEGGFRARAGLLLLCPIGGVGEAGTMNGRVFFWPSGSQLSLANISLVVGRGWLRLRCFDAAILTRCPIQNSSRPCGGEVECRVVCRGAGAGHLGVADIVVWGLLS